MPSSRSVEIEPGFFLAADRVVAVHDLMNRSPALECLAAYRSESGRILHRIASRPLVELMIEVVDAGGRLVESGEIDPNPCVDSRVDVGGIEGAVWVRPFDVHRVELPSIECGSLGLAKVRSVIYLKNGNRETSSLSPDEIKRRLRLNRT